MTAIWLWVKFFDDKQIDIYVQTECVSVDNGAKSVIYCKLD